MSPIQIVTVVFGGMAVMVVTTVCGWEIGSMNNGNLSNVLVGGAIGAVVGQDDWGLEDTAMSPSCPGTAFLLSQVG